MPNGHCGVQQRDCPTGIRHALRTISAQDNLGDVTDPAQLCKFLLHAIGLASTSADCVPLETVAKHLLPGCDDAVLDYAQVSCRPLFLCLPSVRGCSAAAHHRASWSQWPYIWLFSGNAVNLLLSAQGSFSGADRRMHVLRQLWIQWADILLRASSLVTLRHWQMRWQTHCAASSS